MKHIFHIFLVAILLAACNTGVDKNSYVIKGTTGEGYPEDTVYIMTQKNELVASIPIVDGKFEFKGSMAEPSFVMIGPANGIASQFILENGAEYTALLTGARIIVSGGGEMQRLVGYYDNSDEYFNAVMKYERVGDELTKDGKTLDDITPEEETLYIDAVEGVLSAEDRAMFKVIDDPNSPPLAVAFAIRRSQNDDRLPLPKRIEMLKRISKELGGTNKFVEELWKFYENEILEEKAQEEAEKAVAEGSLLQDFEVKDVDGKTMKLSEIVAKNKYTILKFWASWCAPCRAEVPKYKEAYAKYKSKGLEVFYVSLDENKTLWLEALKEENTPWLNAHDEKAFGGSAKLYAVDGIPAAFLFSQDGKLVSKGDALRGKNLDESLARFLK